jgi:hypothetical protein
MPPKVVVCHPVFGGIPTQSCIEVPGPSNACLLRDLNSVGYFRSGLDLLFTCRIIAMSNRISSVFHHSQKRIVRYDCLI